MKIRFVGHNDRTEIVKDISTIEEAIDLYYELYDELKRYTPELNTFMERFPVIATHLTKIGYGRFSKCSVSLLEAHIEFEYDNQVEAYSQLSHNSIVHVDGFPSLIIDKSTSRYGKIMGFLKKQSMLKGLYPSEVAIAVDINGGISDKIKADGLPTYLMRIKKG